MIIEICTNKLSFTINKWYTISLWEVPKKETGIIRYLVIEIGN